MALVLAAWQIHGLEPGPAFLSQHGALAWALVFGLLFANFIASIGTALASPWLARLPGFDMGVLAPLVLVASLMSAFTVRGNAVDLAALAVIGLLGALLRLYGYSVIGVVIGFVLGDVIERSFYTALQSSLGDYSVLVGSPIAAALALATLVAAVFCGAKVLRAKREAAEEAAFSTGAAVFAALLLAALAALLWQTLAPGWRGGPVATGVLALAVVLQLFIVVTTLGGLRRVAVPDAAALLKLGALLLAALALAYWLGFVVAMTGFLLAFWLGVHRMRAARALPLALLFAVALPWAFSWLMEAPLWRGVIAPLVPGLVGGDVAPPL
jgi:large-conductance mechanosensitive channel